MSFTRQPNPVWLFTDLTGNILDDTYYAFFLTNTIPYVPQAVYQDADGLIPWNSPIQFNANGTLPDNLYFTVGQTYRIEIRQGTTSSDPLIYEVNDFIPIGSGVTPTPDLSLDTDNMATNPQFSTILFNSPLSITNAGTTEYVIAPGWILELTGNGTCTITRNSIQGNDNDLTNPPYTLSFVTSGLNNVRLYQRFAENGGIWANNSVSASVLIKADDSTAHLASITYEPSTGDAQVIALGFTNISELATLNGAIDLDASTNTDAGDTAYVDIVLNLPLNGEFTLSNFQVIGQYVAVALPYNQETVERNIDHTFHYYKPQLEAKQIPSYLVGWDFPLNPAQFHGDTVAASAIGANKSKYVWDQTIIFQSADSGVGVSRGTSGELLLTAAATTKMAIVQYLPQAIARKILNNKICCHVSARTDVVGGVGGVVSLFYTTDVSLPDISTGTNNSLVLTLDANGKPATFNGNWTEVPRLLGQDATLTVEESATTNFNDYSLSGWDLAGAADADAATFFAIVVGFESVTIGGTIGVNSVGLMAGDIPARPAPQTLDEVLRECQYYFEKSYDVSVAPGTNDSNGILAFVAPADTDGSTTSVYKTRFRIPYKQTKRASPDITVYTPSGTSGNISVGVVDYQNNSISAAANAAITEWTKSDTSLSSTRYVTNGTTTIIYTVAAVHLDYEGFMNLHYTADARLGIV